MNKKTKILLFTLFFIVVFIVTGFFIVRDVYRELLNQLVNEQAEEKLVIAQELSKTISEEVKETEEKLILMSKLPEIRNGEKEVCNEKLKELSLLNSRLSNIGRVDSERKFRCSLNEAIIGTDAQNLGPYIAQIFDDPEHKTVMSRIIKVPNGGYAVALHVPVYDENGQFDGTLGGALYFDDFSKKFLSNVAVSEQGYVVLQDDDGTIFYHPQKELIGQNMWPKTPEEEANANAITPLIIKSAKDGSSGTSRYISSLDNNEKVGAYAPVNILPGRRWIVLISVPIEAIEAHPVILEAKSAFWRMFILVISSIVIPPVLLIVYLVFSVFRPLEKIGKAAREIGQGNLDKTIQISSHDEIGVLASFFNEMSSRLKQSYQGLEDKVRERTKELQVKEKQLEDAQKAGNVGTFNWDLKENSISISSQVYRMYGVDPDDRKQTIEDFLSLVHPEDRETVSELMKRTPKQNEPFEISYRCIWSNGEIHWLRARGQNVFDENGQAQEVIGTIYDISKEKEIEKMKDEFVSVASHELRTPMGAIKAFVSMILAGDYGKVNKNLEEPLIDIKSSIDRLVNLVNDLLNVARIEAGRMKFTLVTEDVAKTLQSVVSDLRPLAKEKGLKLEIIETKDVRAQYDNDKVKQVLTNLIGNSLKFTQSGAITLHLASNEHFAKISVSDTGTGIAKEDQEKLFGKFQQVNIQGDRPQGTGLGLYISREIIRKLGGDLWIAHSEVGKGTTFTFTLPLEQSPKAIEVQEKINKEAETHPDQK